MAKKGKTLKIPKKIMGFKLSKGTRKDLKKLLKLLGKQDAHRFATSALGALVALLTERMAVQQVPATSESTGQRTKAH